MAGFEESQNSSHMNQATNRVMWQLMIRIRVTGGPKITAHVPPPRATAVSVSRLRHSCRGVGA